MSKYGSDVIVANRSAARVHRCLAAGLLAAAVAAALAPVARAADGTWNSTAADGAWENPANWVGGTVAGSVDPTFSSPDTALFNSASTTTAVVVDANRNVRNVTFDTAAAAAYTIGTTGGNPLLLTSGGAITVNAAVTANQTVNAPLVIGGAAYSFANSATATAALTIGGGVTGGVAGATTLTLTTPTGNGGGTVSGVLGNGTATSLAVTKSGAGTWALSGANTYTGLTLVSAGNLSVTNAAGLGSTAGSTQVNNGGSLRLTAVTISGENLNLAGNDGTNSPLVHVSGTSTYTGAITLASEGTGGGDSRIRSAAGTLNLNGTINSLDNFNIVFQASGAIVVNSVISGVPGAKVIKSSTGTGVLTLNGLNTYDGTTTSSSGVISVNSIKNVGGGASAAGAPTTVANGTIGLSSGTNAGGLQYTGTGDSTDRVLSLTGASGTVTLEQAGTGLLRYTANLAAAAGAKTLQLSGSTAGTGEFAGVIGNDLGTISVTKSGTGTWTLSAANTYTGNTTLNTGGTLNINNAGTGGTSSAIGTGTFVIGGNGFFDNTSGGPITLSTNNPVNLSGGSPTFVGTNDLNFGTGAVTLGGANRTITVANAAATLTLGGAVGEDATPRNFTKAGAGTLRLAGNTTYTGTTTVSAGTLLLNGSTSATAGTLSVGNNATLGGTGSIGSLLTVAAGGTLLAGDNAPADDLSLGGGFTLSTGSLVRLALGPAGTHSSLTRTGGTATFAAAQSFSIADFGATPGTYQNVIAGLAADPGTTGAWTIVTPGFVGMFTYDNPGGAGNIDLTVTAVPEPTTAGLLAVAAVGLLARRRRRA